MLLLIGLLSAVVSIAQNGTNPFSYHLELGTGFVAPHRPIMRHLNQGHVQDIALRFEWQGMDSTQDWHQIYNQLHYGLAVHWVELGNPEQLGNAFAVYPYFQFPFIRKNNFEWSFRTGAGLGFLTQPFDQENNQKNIAIGSYLNSALHVLSQVSYEITPRWKIQTGLSLLHFSNGASRAPNLGLNLPLLHVGVGWRNSALSSSTVSKRTSPALLKRSWWAVQVNLASKENNPPGGGKFLATTLSLQFRRDFSLKSSYTIQADAFYNSARADLMEQNNDPIASSLEVMQLGLSAGYNLRVGKVHILVQQGVYVLDFLKLTKATYNRIGARYQFNEKWAAMIKLKTHLAVADHLEFGVVYYLK